MSNIILEVSQVSKSYSLSKRDVPVLYDITFSIEQGSSISIVGSSGSGKTTLLGLCAGLDQVSSGSIRLFDDVLGEKSEDELATLRSEYIGFVFQNFQLLPTLTALENVMVPMELKGLKNVKSRAEELLSKVGLKDRAAHYPTQLSGGEQQRVSIARAFSNDPKILFADEPTGNLDYETGQLIEDLLFDLNRQEGTTLVLVTHDRDLASKTERIIPIKGGRIG